MSRYLITPVTVEDVTSVVGADCDSNLNVIITGITQNSKEVRSGDLYCCIRGENFDGHNFINEAVELGAVAVLIDRDIEDIADHVAIIKVNDVREVLGLVASAVFGTPASKLTIVGITGTNGKTSTAAMLSAILAHAGYVVHTMGTLTQERTTPEAIDVHARLAQCVNDDVTHVVMEVSSHALALHRVAGVMFNLAVLTNIGRDHLDFHGTEEAYFAAKAKLFEPRQSVRGVVNIDDARGRLLNDVQPIDITTFSLRDITDMEVEVHRVRFVWRQEIIEIPLGGIFTVMNALAAMTTASQLGLDVHVIADGLRDLAPITGRFENVANSAGIDVIVDYAHTPDGLSTLLETTRAVTHGRVIVVFGCGGNRDRGKRPIMGKIASEMADVVVVTSDNPRFENPLDIITEVLAGISGSERVQVISEPDRITAITSAIYMAKHGDIVVLAGKGHESTQEVNGVQTPFSDIDKARDALRRREEATQ
jgi:UDP-N-acetylmuramoyl-L-alanyl-D-glutamate--2,6-diaminopimelate ligase